MFARVTTFEVDTVRVDVSEALERFKELVLPELRKQPGFKGLQVLTTPEGKGMLLSFWESEASAMSGVQNGFYNEQVSKLMMFIKQPPGREHYEVIYSEGAALAILS
jgi:heme-degrading monooxygenase HmoA